MKIDLKMIEVGLERLSAFISGNTARIEQLLELLHFLRHFFAALAPKAPCGLNKVCFRS